VYSTSHATGQYAIYGIFREGNLAAQETPDSLLGKKRERRNDGSGQKSKRPETSGPLDGRGVRPYMDLAGC
jgi:hypothetical protein